MFDTKELFDKNTSIDPDFSIYDIDIDFELNDGKGAWVVIMQRKDSTPQPLSVNEETKGEKHECCD